MFDWVFDTPLWIVGPGLVVFLGGVSLASVFTVRSWVHTRIHVTDEDSEFVSTLVHSIMVFYGLVLALIAVNVFETYSEASGVVTAESSAMAMLYRDFGSYPEPARTELQAALKAYAEDVINVAWPKQRMGRIPSGGVSKMDEVQTRMAGFEPATEGQKALHAEAWRAYNHLIDTRRTRLDEVTKGLPGVMWLVVLLGAAISLLSASFFRVADVRLHAALVLLLSTFIASIIFVMVAMDHPFRGDLGLSSEPYQLIYDHLMKS